MPRPKDGYKNVAGFPVPGTSDINGRFMDRRRLMYWSYNRGKAGVKLYDDSAINIGSTVHMMAELDLKDRPADDIEFYATTTLPDQDELAKARVSFTAFRDWRRQFHVRPAHQEVSLVSEKFQFGGTIDTIATIRNGLGMLEFKTSAEVYEDHLLQMAAYGILWDETHPNEPLTAGYHLILLPKDGAKFRHMEYSRDQLKPFRKKFKLYRKAFDLDLICNTKEALVGAPVAPSPAPTGSPVAPKRRATVKPAPVPSTATMAEILRSYGHVNGGVAA